MRKPVLDICVMSLPCNDGLVGNRFVGVARQYQKWRKWRPVIKTETPPMRNEARH